MTPEQHKEALDIAVKLCKEFEGFSARPYLCPAKVPTIGYGATRYLDGRKVTMDDEPISILEAGEMLRSMLAGFQTGVLFRCPNIDSVGLLAACTDLAYNIGLNAFGSSTLRKVINSGGDRDAIAEQFRRWNRGGGVVLKGLVRRREAEIALIK